MDVGETKIIELEEELRVVANNLKSLEVPSRYLFSSFYHFTSSSSPESVSSYHSPSIAPCIIPSISPSCSPAPAAGV